MIYETIFKKEFDAEFGALDNSIKQVAKKKIKKILDSPLLGKPLHGEPFLFSERFLSFRIVYKVDGNKIIFLRIAKRGSVYDLLN